MCNTTALGEIWDKEVTVFFYLQLLKGESCIYNPSSLPWSMSGILGKRGDLCNVAVLLHQGQRCGGSQAAGVSFLLAPGSSAGSLSCQLPALGKWVPGGTTDRDPSCPWQMVKAPASQQHWEHHWSERVLLPARHGWEKKRSFGHMGARLAFDHFHFQCWSSPITGLVFLLSWVLWLCQCHATSSYGSFKPVSLSVTWQQ